jgi:hypothetical protein
MAKVTLRASGGLNNDVDVNNLPEGDYTIANNIIFDGGKDGGAGAIKMLDSIKTLGLTTISGTIKETFLNTDGTIYVLVYVNSTTASIYRIVPNMLSNPVSYANPTQMLTYPHGGIDTAFVPDLRVLGNTIVWNYATEGTSPYNQDGIPLSFYIPTYVNTLLTPALSDLKLQKQTPNNVVTITKTAATGIEFLESNDFQFASRYQYSSYEFSALGNYSQIYKGEKGTANYSISYVFSGKPAYASYLELYVRIGNNGVWRRIDTVSTSSSSSLTWTGQVYESLDIITTGKPFDAVPISAYSIEVAKNRIFLANIQDEYKEIAAVTLQSPPTTNGYAFPSGSDVKTFKSGVVTTTGVTSSENGSYVKPFANNSTYAIGVAFYDAAMKTRGVEAAYTKFTTGIFDYPVIPSVTFNITGGAPSWAKYAQVVYSKNISKSYIFEGFASSIFFEVTKPIVNELTKEVTTVKSFIQSVGKDDLKNITAFVIDIMGMVRAGRIYTWTEGDYAAIRTPNGVLTLKIIGQVDNLVYCAYSGIEMTNTTTVDPATLPFEFYTPKQQQEDESLVFYEYGNLIPVTTSTTSITVGAENTLNGSATASKLLGDMVFSTIEMPTYTVSPFTVDVSKSSPTVEDVSTVVNSTHAFSTLQLGVVGPVNTGGYQSAPKSETPILTSIPTNGDGASIIDALGAAASTGTSFKMSGYYVIGQQESGVNKLSVTYNLQATEVLSLLTLSTGLAGNINYAITAQVYRNPFNNTTFLYDKTPEKFGSEFNLLGGYRSVLLATTGTVVDLTSTQVIDFKNDIKNDINPNDAFYVVLTLQFNADGNVDQSTVTIAKKTGQTNSVVFSWNGDRTPVNTITSFNYNAPVSATKTKYLIRSVSNATTNPYWNTSSGKPLLAASNIAASRRGNTIRYGGNYVQGTKVNNVNSFFSLDSNDVAIENGDITSLQRATRLQGNGSMMLVLCQKESAYIMLGEQELSQGNNSSIRALTANMIGTIRNFGDNLGLIDKKSVMNYKGTIWWWDNFNKKVVKYTPDGLELPSDTYMRSFFRNQSGVATFCYDAFHNMCFVSIGSNAQSMGYSDNLKRWISAYDFVPDFCESFGDRMIAFKSGIVYRSLESGNKADYNSFLGASAVDGNITFVLNSRLPVNPLNVAVWHSMNVTDYTQSNYVKSNLMTIGITNENSQSTSIVESNFLLEDNRLYAHVMRDVNTPSVTNPIVTGNYMVGYQNAFQIVMKDKTQNMRINSIDVEISPVSGHS